jgi:hypothetical protein
VADPDSGPDPAIFVLDLPKMATKNEFKKKNIFGLYFLKDKKSKRSHKAIGIKVFLTFLAWR